MTHDRNLLESYNARHLRLRDIAATFVSSEFFEVLASPRHSLLLGPRGSGKTTLLRMLQQPALELWTAPDADKFRATIEFTGVFVATDRTWVSQLLSLSERLRSDSDARAFTTAIVSINVCRSFVSALTERLRTSEDRPNRFRRRVLSEPEQVNLCRGLASAWGIDLPFPSLASLHSQLGNCLVGLDRLATRESFLGQEGRGERLANENLLHFQFPVALTPAIDMANEALGEPDGRWAMLFDELELAPVWLQDKLLELLRSVDSRMLFKMALSPFAINESLRSIMSPSASHDYDPIPLWFGEKDDARLKEFCRNIWEGIAKADSTVRLDAEDALGPSRFDLGSETRRSSGTAYEPGSPIAVEFANLAAKDRSFRNYIRGRHLEPENWPTLSGVERAKSIRKIQHIVIARNYYRGIAKMRSRKAKDLYCGAATLFAVSEGNPRILKAIISRLLLSWNDREKPIPRPAQAAAMLYAAERFEALLVTVPVPNLPGPAPALSVVDLLRQIAGFFHRVAILDDFQEEPPGSFVLDKAIGDAVVETLRSAINMGAVILLPGGRGSIEGELIGSRLRLSYLISMKYDALVRLGRAVNLSTMIPSFKGGRRHVVRAQAQEKQLPLLDEGQEGQGNDF